MKKSFILFLSFLSIISCTRDADIDVPQVDPTLSVSCFISPEKEMSSAAIFWSRPVFSQQSLPEFPDDLTVILIGNNTADTMTYDPISSNYQLPTSVFPIIAGQEYRLEVIAPNGKRVTAKTSIPLELPIVNSFNIEKNERTDQNNTQYFQYIFKMVLGDPSSSFNYYQSMFYFVLNGYTGFLSQSFKDDASLQNSQLYIETEYEQYYSGFEENPEFEVDSLQYIVINGTEEYYRFHRTLQNQSPGDPFSEPVIVYSNIENGLGIFAGYRSVLAKVALP